MSYRLSAISAVVLSMLYASGKVSAQEPLPVFRSAVLEMQAVLQPEPVTITPPVDLDNPASFLYPDWDNGKSISYYSNIKLPDTVYISMDGYHMPTDSTRITDTFGYRPRRGRIHYGLDVKVMIGDTVRAAFDGKVRVSEYQRKGYGHYLVIRHPNGLETVYGHLSKKLVEENQIVHAGDPIGLGGNTGRSTGSHLHFETRLAGRAINPSFMFDFPNQRAVTDCYMYLTKTAPEYYKVKKGDTLGGIAMRNSTTVSKLRSLNNMSTKSVLREGQTLRIR
ncbi:MAG: peptidoglycan DD-metalloendopeptidase family protein [Bacteroidaceae bacterium]|nr:peptidoglycan DD-metalloendopeptidase family protein [Bacteroidaceae bacterium]